MYIVKNNKAQNLLEINNSINSVYGKTYLDRGLSLQEVTLGAHKIIRNLSPLDYSKTYMMNSIEKVVLGEHHISTSTQSIENGKSIKIKSQFIDDCWILYSDKVVFKTPEYNLQLDTYGNNNFLQELSPPTENTKALRLTKGLSSSFNKKRLQKLKPNESYNINWSLNININ